MTAPVITARKLYLQKTFSMYSDRWVRMMYKIAPDEKLLCAVWVSPSVRRGFVVTDKALRWLFLAEDAPAGGALLKGAVAQGDFSVSGTEGMLRLEIMAGGHTFMFFFSHLAEEKARTLCDILHFGYTQGMVPQVDLSVLLDDMPLLSVRNVLDSALVFLSALPEKLKPRRQAEPKPEPEAKLETEPDAHGAATSNASSSENAAPRDGSKDQNAEKIDNSNTKFAKPNFFDAEQKESEQVTAVSKQRKDKPIILALFYVFDIIASLCFLLDSFTRVAAFPTDLHYRYSYLICYVALRLAVILFAKTGVRKILSSLLMLLLIASNLFILTVLPYSIYVIFCGLLYFSLEYSLGKHTKTILIQLKFITILGFALYLYMHAVSNSCVKAAFGTIRDALLPKKVKLPWRKLLQK